MPATKLTRKSNKDAAVRTVWQRVNETIEVNRVRRGIKTHKELAEMIGISQQTLSDRLNFKRPWGLNEIFTAVWVLDISAEDTAYMMRVLK